ncbi:MAG: dipicolinate synthase subunit B [Clostridia bacterium]|nr:dipicolinate synthase subunit B [Clostridia bacterium]
MKDKRIGFAMCGSFCTFSEVIPQIKILSELGADITPIMSETVYSTSTRFGTAEHFINQVKEITGKEIIHSIQAAEPIGPKELLDILIVAPCTGNTLGKLALGITDTAVTMATKAHLRNERPVVIAVSTNDALSASAKNIGQLMNSRNIYFVPFSQDAPYKKTRSCVAKFELIPATVSAALGGNQIEPIFL